ncbi:MAG TPA: hypothetical protein VF422_10455, partial [Dokdonella sp.]
MLRRTVLRRSMPILFLFAAPAGAATYQVGPSRPYQTLNALLDAEDLAGGDLVEVDGNATYPAVVIRAADGGSPGNPVVFRGIRV